MSDLGYATCDGRALISALGGVRGVVEGARPPLVFVAVNAAVRASSNAVWIAAAAALLAGVLLVVSRVSARDSITRPLLGLSGVALAVGLTLWSGDARDFFLPGIWVDASYALVLIGSVIVGRPLLGVIHAGLFGRPRRWWIDRNARRAYGVVTLGWAGMYAVRAGVQTALYVQDRPGLLALAKVALGWPMTAAAVVLSLLYLNRVPDVAGTKESGRPSPCPAAPPRLPGLTRTDGGETAAGQRRPPPSHHSKRLASSASDQWEMS